MFKKLEAMRDQVREELQHIPRGDSSQNMLRAIYWVERMHSLGKKAKSNQSKEEILKESIEFIKREHSGFVPQYDKKFFKSQN